MKPPRFEYHAPATVAEVLALLAAADGDGRVLAGGQSLVPLMNLRMAQPEVLIDLNKCPELATISETETEIRLGAMVRQIDAEHDALIQRVCPLISQALAKAGPVAVRHRATIGGTIAHADRSAELPAVVVALGAVMEVAGPDGTRDVGAPEFFFGDMMTAIEPEEMLIAVRFPKAPEGSFTAFREVGFRREGVALVGLAASLQRDGAGAVTGAGFAVVGVEPAPVRLEAAEAALIGAPLSKDRIEEAVAATRAGIEAEDDHVASANYRRRVAGALVSRVLTEAMQEADR
jgi:carbon-monoxide dehydrogenase medium subunit